MGRLGPYKVCPPKPCNPGPISLGRGAETRLPELPSEKPAFFFLISVS